MLQNIDDLDYNASGQNQSLLYLSAGSGHQSLAQILITSACSFYSLTSDAALVRTSVYIKT